MRTVSLHLIPDADRVEISFPYDREIVGLVRTVTGRQWHRDRLRWSVPRVELDRLAVRLGEVGIRLIVAVAGSGAADAPAGADGTGRPGQDAPSGPWQRRPRSGDGGKRASRSRRVELTEARAREIELVEEEMKLRRYSARTRRCYVRLLRRFLADVPPGRVDGPAVRGYVLGFVERGASSAYHGQLRAALRFYAEHVLRDLSVGCVAVAETGAGAAGGAEHGGRAEAVWGAGQPEAPAHGVPALLGRAARGGTGAAAGCGHGRGPAAGAGASRQGRTGPVHAVFGRGARRCRRIRGGDAAGRVAVHGRAR